MKKTVLIFFICLWMQQLSGQQVSCVSVIRPVLSATTKKEYDEKLAAARTVYLKDSTNADAIIWYGRRMAYTGNYEQAIEIFSTGIKLHPADARFYRHRGHRYITLRCFDKAIADLKKAGRLIKDRPDEIEPDGLPNVKNIPTSTLHSNIWYHLGLAYYIKRRYKDARRAYSEGLKISTHPDMYVATTNWMNITLRRLKRNRDAVKLYYTIKLNEELIESRDYMRLIELYRDKPNENEIEPYLKAADNSSLSSATLNYGIGVYCLLMGYREKALAFFNKAIASNQWSSFGYIAAEAELNKMVKQVQ